MKLRFWKREKKIEDMLLIDQDTLASNEMESMDLVHKSYDHKTPIIASADDIFGEDNIPDQIKITKGQCIGFKKSGERCTRNIDTVYCYQHKRS